MHIDGEVDDIRRLFRIGNGTERDAAAENPRKQEQRDQRGQDSFCMLHNTLRRHYSIDRAGKERFFYGDGVREKIAKNDKTVLRIKRSYWA